MKREILQIGDTGSDVKYMQQLAGIRPPDDDGIFGGGTKKIIVGIQKANGLNPDGIVGDATWGVLLNRPSKFKDTKIKGTKDMPIFEYPLKSDEYYPSMAVKKQIVGHHTAGWNKATGTVNYWENDKTSKGGVRRVGTSFLISRYDSINQDDFELDGQIVRCFDERYWAYHIGGVNGLSGSVRTGLEKGSIGIEVNAWGQLIEKNGNLYTWAKTHFTSEKDVYEYSDPWRGYKYYEKYSDKQIDSLGKLLKALSKHYDIDISNGNITKEWFDVQSPREMIKPGLKMHTHFRRDKWDLHPQENLIEMLNSL